MKKTLLLFFLLIGCLSSGIAQTQKKKEDVKYTKYPVDLRTGPGAYFDFVSRAFANTQVKPLSKDGGWQEIMVEEQKGWIPATALSDTPKSKTPSGNSSTDRMNMFFNEMSTNPGSANLTASKAEVAAAVKGFARKYKAAKGQSSTVNLTPHFENRIDWNAYKSFRKSRIADVMWYHRKENLSISDSQTPDHDPTLDQTGFAIASILASSGLVEDYQLLEYLNYMALFIVESSHRFEIPVQVHVLNTDEVLGFAVPGGYIFVSKGALKLMNNEAELAHFLAHEVAHLTFEHGFQEYEKRRPRINSAKAFEELDNDLSDQDSTKYTAVDEELSAWTDEVYDYVSKPRLENYEIEADYWGLVYAYRAGYAPEFALDYLGRLQSQSGNMSSQVGTMEWTGTPLQKRMAAIQKSLKKLNIRGGDTYKSEFMKMKQRLR